MPNPIAYDVAVIGCGLAGLSAAVRAASAGASVVCFEATSMVGGLVANIGRLDDYPGGGALAGTTLADELATRARELGVVLVNAEVNALDLAQDRLSIIAGTSKYSARTVIIASGAHLRKLGVPGEAELVGRGVSQCDWCDGGLNRGKRVAVVGGGNAACQAALHLAEGCASVLLVVRGTMLRARRDYVTRVADNSKIEFHWATAVKSIAGTDGVDGLVLKNLADGGTSNEACAAVFVFAGLTPNLQFAPALLKRDEDGFAFTDGEFRCSMPRVFVVGAARSGNEGSLVSAMGEAVSAAAAAVAGLE